jgi:hypothetical protein
MNSLNENLNDSFVEFEIQNNETSTVPFVFLSHVGYVYIEPISSSICFILNSACLVVFIFGKEMNDKFYLYFKAKTIGEMVVTLLGALAPLNLCEMCSTTTSLFSQIYSLYGVNGLGYVASNFLGFMEVMIVYDRYITVKSNSKINFKINNWIFVGIFLAISIAFTIPFMFEYRIAKVEIAEKNLSFFMLKYTGFGQSKCLYFYRLVNSFLVSAIYCLLLPILSVALCLEFGKFIDKKNALTNRANSGNMTNEQFDAKKNLISMVLVLTAIFITSRIVMLLALSYHTYTLLNMIVEIDLNYYLNFFAYDLNYSLTTGVNFFIYIKFNRNFRTSCLDLLQKITPCLPHARQAINS